jgi:hypothetical protein
LYTATAISGTYPLPATHRRYRLVVSGDVTIEPPPPGGADLAEDIELVIVGDTVQRQVTAGSGWVVLGERSIAVAAGATEIIPARWDGSAWVWARRAPSPVNDDEKRAGAETALRSFAPKDIVDLFFNFLLLGSDGNFGIKRPYTGPLAVTPKSLRLTGTAPSVGSGRFYLAVLTGAGSDAVDVFYDTETAKLWCVTVNAGVETRYSAPVAPGAPFDQSFTFSPAAPPITYGYFGMTPRNELWPNANFGVYINA